MVIPVFFFYFTFYKQYLTHKAETILKTIVDLKAVCAAAELTAGSVIFNREYRCTTEV